MEVVTLSSSMNAYENDMKNKIRVFEEQRNEDETMLEYAVRTGDLDLVKLLHEKEDRNIDMDVAIQYGHLDIVKFLHEKKHGVRSYAAMDDAAKYGHLEVLKFMSEHVNEADYTITEFAMVWAAMNGHLDVVKWVSLYSGGGWEDQGIEAAEENGHTDIVDYLKLRTEELEEAGCQLFESRIN